MTSPHIDPESHGTTFGSVILTVDVALADCIVRAPRGGLATPVMLSTRYHSLEEMQGAYLAQRSRAATDPVSADIARALKFAVQYLKSQGVAG